jgi:uncharacterized protein YcbX
VTSANGNARITRIAIAPVKGLALQLPEAVTLGRNGVAEDRRLHMVDANGRLVNDKNALRLMLVESALDLESGTFALRFPEGDQVGAELALGEPITTIFYGRPVRGNVLVGPWAAALSHWVGLDIRFVMSEKLGAAIDRGARSAVSIISGASVSDIARAGGAEQLDARRFRMLFEVDGVDAYAEETWIGRDVRIGDAVVRPHGNVGRCVVTTCDPDTAERDFDTLKVLARHRKDVETSEPLPLGVVGKVVTPGRVRVGDPVRIG